MKAVDQTPYHTKTSEVGQATQSVSWAGCQKGLIKLVDSLGKALCTRHAYRNNLILGSKEKSA